MTAKFHLWLVLISCYSIVRTQGLSELLYANRRDIRMLDAGSPQNNATVVISGLEDAAALDFLYDEEVIFWTDVSLEVIQAASFSDPQSKWDVITTGLVSPDGLACDWLGKKLYWTDSDTNRIEVSNLDGSYRKVLFWQGLDQPRAIALDPENGYMYWSDWGEEPKIEKAGMDGNPETRHVLISEDIHWPNGLAIDYTESKLYWADAKRQSINVCNLDGSEKRQILAGTLPHPFSLTVFAEKIYWTDWDNHAIYSCDKHTGKSKRKIHGHIFSPMYIHAFSGKKQKKGPNPCENNPCSHLCLMSPLSPYYTCACPTGILLQPDNQTCNDGFHEILLLARRTDLRRISLDTPDYTDVVLRLNDIKHAVAIDYDHIDDYVYWTDDETRAISRAHLDGSGQEMVVATEVESPDGVAVDWIARNLYWTDTGTNRIEVARLNGTSRKVLISDGLDEPRAIALDPYYGYMYWTDWGKQPKIERSFLDGTERVQLVNTSIVWPNGLALDFVHRKLYWGDARTDKIEVANMDGTGREILLSGPDILPHIFGFTLLGDYIYWTDWQRRTIDRVNRFTHELTQPIVDLLPDLMGLKAVNMSLTLAGSNACGKNNGGCSHLCFMRQPPLSHICACPMGLELMKDSKTCIVPEAFLLFAHRTDIRRISLEYNYNNVIIPLQGVQEATALDFDINDSRIYWTDTDLKSISRAFMNGSALENVVEFGLGFPEGMAVDWVAHNLYWADTGTSRIEMSRMDGSSRRVLIWSEVEPRALVLDPPNGYMYFSNWYKSPRIERAMLDGTNRIPLISHTGRVNGLTIDFQEQRLYWASVDSRIIESSNLLGEDRHEVVRGLMHPFSLTQYQDFIYWADWNSKSIERANKTNGQNRTKVQEKMDFIMDILIFHNSRQSGWNSCNVDNGGCSHLCVAHGGNNTTHYSHHCSCPTHYMLSADNRTCIPPTEFLLCSQKNRISRMLPDPNKGPYMVLPIRQIRNIQTMDFNPMTNNIYWVDRRSGSIKHANINGSKVQTAIHKYEPYDLSIDIYTRHIYWTDAQENVIRMSKLDGTSVGVIVNESHQKPRAIAVASEHGYIFWTNVVDPPHIERAALDGTEMQTQFSTELGMPGAIAVDSKSAKIFWTDLELQMIATADFDGSNRRVLVSDEILHPVGLTVLGRFLYWVDRETEVMQKMDKLTGQNRDIMHSRLPALRDVHAVKMITIDDVRRHPCGINNGNCSHICVASIDGTRRCSCPIGLMLTSDELKCANPPTCQSDHFTCKGGNTPCIPISWRCDGQAECEDNSDEQDCHIECTGDSYHKCTSTGSCVPLEKRCNQVADCSDNSDELNCPPCAIDMFECKVSRQCIAQPKRCDSYKDCLNGEDELHCPSSYHSQGEDSKTYIYIILFAIVVSFVLLIIVVVYCRRKKPHDLLSTSIDGLTMKNQLADAASDLSGTLLGATADMPQDQIHINLLGSSHTQSTTNNSCVTFNMIGDGSSGPPYDRNHVTGASSSSSSVTHYPKETLNPPPSPITDGSVFTGIDDNCSSNSLVTDLYSPFKLADIPPFPTPCSTDVCDDSEPAHRSTRRKTRLHGHSHSHPRSHHGQSQQVHFDSDPLCPPPPTPRSDLSCPPSPSTERSYYNPYPPPPSPVGSSEC